MTESMVGKVRGSRAPRRGLRAAVCAVAVATAVALTGCSLNSGRSDGGGGDATTLRIGTTTDVANFNPLQSLSKTDNWILNVMYPHLLRIDGDARKQPELAESYSYTDGGKTAVFKLRDDFTWTDGKPVTSADVKYSAEMIMKYKLGNVAAKLTWVESIDAPDATTVQFHLSEPYTPFAEGVGFWMSIVPKHVFEKAGDISKFANDSDWVGAGPFVLDSFTKGQRYVMKRNDKYPLAPGGKAALSSVEYRIYPDVNTMMLALRNGDIDMMATPVPASAAKSLAGDKKLKLAKVSALGFAHLTRRRRLRRTRQRPRRVRPGAGHQPARPAATRTGAGVRVHRARPVGGADIADEVAVMYLGKVAERGPEDEIDERPAHPYTKALLSAVPVPDPVGREERQRILLRGDPPSPVDPPSGCRFRTRCWQAEARCADEEPPLLARPAAEHPVACHFPLAPDFAAADALS